LWLLLTNARWPEARQQRVGRSQQFSTIIKRGEKTMVHASRITALSAIALLICSCGGAKEPVTDTVAATTRPQEGAQGGRGASTPDPAAVIALAKTYRFSATLMPPVRATAAIDTSGNNKPVRKSDDPVLTFARAEPVPGTSYPVGQEVLLLIHAQRAYRGLDIGAGDNYLWRDTSDSNKKNWQVWLISENPPNAVQLKRGSGPYSSIDPELAHLVRQDFQAVTTSATGQVLTTDMIVFGGCIEDDVCQPSGHCGYSQ
jgi:hypothetical protein